jgi:hypothetical protein
MGILNFFAKPAAALMLLPRGSFTVDREGRVLASTLPQSFPDELAKEIALDVLEAFRKAQDSKIVVREFVIRYANLKLTARELRGGAIIFLVPQTLSSSQPG